MSANQARVLLSTEFWMDWALSLDEFVEALRGRFPEVQIDDVIERPPPAPHRPHHRLVMLLYPADQNTEVVAFMDEYARLHSAVHTLRPREGSPHVDS